MTDRETTPNTETAAPANNRGRRRRRALALLGLSAMVAYATPALVKLNPAAASGGIKLFGGGSGAGMGGASGGGNIPSANPLIEKECGECHTSYAARWLLSGSWRKIMNDLPNHFGEDASLNDATRKKVADYLAANAGGSGTGPIRISQTRWFKGEHRGDVTRHKAKSWSNCLACHR